MNKSPEFETAVSELIYITNLLFGENPDLKKLRETACPKGVMFFMSEVGEVGPEKTKYNTFISVVGDVDGALIELAKFLIATPEALVRLNYHITELKKLHTPIKPQTNDTKN